MTRRIHDYPDDPEEWPDLEDELIPDPRELPTSGPYGPAFTYLHAARVTLDAGLTQPTLLLTRTGARLILKTAGEHGHEVTDQEASDLEEIAHGQLQVQDPEDLLDALATLSAFVERRLSVPDREPR